MGSPVTRSLFAVLFISLLALPAFAFEKPKVGGYYKNIFSTSKTVSGKKAYVSYLQRVRFDINEKISDKISARLMIDNDFLLNDYSTSPDFNVVREYNQRELAFWDTHNVLVNKRDLFWTESFYRAYIQYDTPLVKCVIGKQNIDWDRMRFYHPFDLFNPVSPLQIEKDEKMGVDAVNIELRAQPFMSYNFIYAPDRSGGLESYGLRFASKVRDYDIFLMAADIEKDYYVGFAFDGYLKESGLRGEVSYTFNHNYNDKVIDNGNYNDDPDNFLRASIGMDRSFTSKLYGIIEYFYNGVAKIMNAPLFISSLPYSRRALTITKHILGAGLEYEAAGITKLNNYLFYDFEGKSLFYNPEFKWSIKPNADITIGCQIFTGDSDSEYGNYHNLFYAEMKIYF
ncbi:MAG: hypothetical protein V1927_03660 [Candidatus Omnitrophota bacterium]